MPGNVIRRDQDNSAVNMSLVLIYDFTQENARYVAGWVAAETRIDLRTDRPRI